MLERLGAAVTCAVLAVAAWREWWPFDASPKPVTAYEKPSIWQFLMSDRLTLGFARVLIAGLAIYVAGSVVALMIARRWLRTFGTAGLSTDEVETTSQAIRRLEGQNEDLEKKLAAAISQIDRVTRERDQTRETLRTIIRRAARAATTTTTRPVDRPIVREEQESDERRRDSGDKADA